MIFILIITRKVTISGHDPPDSYVLHEPYGLPEAVREIGGEGGVIGGDCTGPRERK
jgi:hypothetical protein